MQPSHRTSEQRLRNCKSGKALPGSKLSAKKTKSKVKEKSLSQRKKGGDSSFQEDRAGIEERRNEYYNKEKKGQSRTKGPHGCGNYSEYINLSSSGRIGGEKTDRTGSIGNKIQLDKVKGSINFEGKFVKNSAETVHLKGPAQWQFSCENYTEMVSCQEDRNKKRKSKSKSRGKLLQESHIKGKTKLNKIASIKAIDVKIPEDNFEDLTKSTPHSSISCERKEEIDIDTLKLHIEQDLQKRLQFHILRKVSFEKRGQCISFMSRLCGDLQLRKNVFALSISLFDSYLNDQVLISKHKHLALACIILALKLEEAEAANLFVFYLPTGSQTGQEIKGDERHSKSVNKDKGKKKESEKETEKQKEREQKEGNKDEVEIRVHKKFKGLKKILRQQIEQPVSRAEVFEFETMVLLKEDFKIYKRTYCYWVDLLTMLWDKFILEDRLDSVSNYERLLFRCFGSTKNFAYLLQILEASIYTTQFYEFSLVVLVMSAMYLLVRINMEGGDEGYDYYRVNLQKSSNILFVDRKGVNQVFGQFLTRVEVEMGEVLGCCQFLSTYLNQSILNDFLYQIIPSPKFDYTLSTHFYNPKLFPF